MRPLSYVRATDAEAAIATVAGDPAAAFLAGGTTEVDLVRLGVARPDLLVDIDRLPLGDVTALPGGGVRIGALARMSDVAEHELVAGPYPAIAQALLLGASPQLRNMASMGGNLCQRVRCAYFRDAVSPCNKREPGSGCSALEGLNRGHAILGTSEHCIATHPSDVAVALSAFDAVVHTQGPRGRRAIALGDFFLAPGETPDLERALAHGELIVAIEVPPAGTARHSSYRKYRDRRSYEFALVSVAAALHAPDGVIEDVRLALGGVGTTPWRAHAAEERLIGAPATPERFADAAAEELRAAVPRRQNAFKVELARRAIVRALTELTAGAAR
jgi:xanthine dehydrogenase YagS FAD-binding subunit